MKKTLLTLLAACLLLTGCAAEPPPAVPDPSEAAPRPVYAIVVKDTGNPYMQRMAEGFFEACGELGVDARLVGPGDEGVKDQAELIQTLISEAVSAIAIAANDRTEVTAALQEAVAAGIPVVSLDSVVDPSDRMVHIQQASPEMIGRVLIQAGALMIEKAGEIAILTTTPTMPNQASWVKWMRYELSNNPEKYERVALVETVYGLDEYEASTEETRLLLTKYPALELIIAPTVMGLRAAAELIAETGSAVKVTGLGLPSEMAKYIDSGVCPWMYLWNPSEVGYLAAYATDALVSGKMTGAVGEILSAGSLGDKVVTLSEDGGSEIVLGNPKLFDSTNITMWKEVF